MRLSVCVPAKPVIASYLSMTSVNLEPRLSPAGKTTLRAPLVPHESALEIHLPGAAYDCTPRIRPAGCALPGCPGRWSHHLLSRSRADQRSGHSSPSRRSDFLPHVSADVG